MRATLIALAILSLARPAFAGDASIDIEHFRPQIDGRGLFGAESADAHKQWQWGVGFWLHYAKNPLVIRSAGDKVGDQVNDRLTGSILFSLGLTRWLELGMSLPLSFFNDQQAGLLGGSSSVAGLGQMRFQLKVAILEEARHGIGLSFLPLFLFPTGDIHAFLGQNGIVFSPTLLLERGAGPVRFLFNFGYTARSQARYLDLIIDDEIFWKIGIGWRVSDYLELGTELFGKTAAASAFGGDERYNPLELLVGARILLTDKLQIVGGIGPGLSRGYGAATFRFFAGLTYSPHERDTDDDGLPDRKDRCPLTPGPRSNQGCPIADRDRDGTPDVEDACPDTPGPKELKGCPDTDKDGILDKDDRCPKDPGPKKYRGCPDTDGDGIPDIDDRCPKVPGPRANRGCPWPDTDKDGILDKDDRCPKVPGPRANGGCPWPDTDKDGVLDKDDRCPKVPGPRANRGCPWPDTDGDGVLDKDDRCPRQPGPASNQGCPKARVVVTRTEIQILQQVFFRTGSAVIQSRSYGILNEVADTLKKYKDVVVEVQGHTDDVGGDNFNLKLSQRRARSVRQYLLDRGIAKHRVLPKGYGETRPKVPVTRGMTKAQMKDARSQNRRVQFVILKQNAK